MLLSMHKRATEACAEKQKAFLQRVELGFTRTMLIFIDESAVVRSIAILL